MLEMFNLSGKKAIITGAAGNLCKGMAEALHDAGAEVVIMDLLDKGADTAAEIGKTGAPAHFVKVNLRDRQDLNAKFKDALDKLGGHIDILINGAGAIKNNAVEDYTDEEWDMVIDINLTAAFMLCQLAGREMLKQGSGKIINVASMLAFFGGYRVPSYAASKGALAQLTKTLCNEWAKHGINVNAIAPGYMETSFNAHILPNVNPERYNSITERIPAGRWGCPEDLKGLAVFLSSRASDYINGAVIPCDGGYLVR